MIAQLLIGEKNMTLQELKDQSGGILDQAFDLGKQEGGKIYSQAELDAAVLAGRAELKALILAKLDAQQVVEGASESSLKSELEGLN